VVGTDSASRGRGDAGEGAEGGRHGEGLGKRGKGREWERGIESYRWSELVMALVMVRTPVPLSGPGRRDGYRRTQH